MIRYSCITLLLCFVGCAGASPDPQEVLEKSRKTTAEVEKKVEATQKSTEQAMQNVEEMKQKPPAPADVY